MKLLTATLLAAAFAAATAPAADRRIGVAEYRDKVYGARLTLLHVTACGPDVNLAAGEELRRLQGFVGAEADLAIETGEPARVICAAAERLKADVLVIGRGSAAGVFGRLRTNAYAIIRQSPCPVVSV